MDGKRTWEYKKFQENSAALAGWLGSVPGRASMIAGQLASFNLIDAATSNQVMVFGPTVAEVSRITPILADILGRIEIKKGYYQKFRVALVDVLGEAAELYVDAYLPEPGRVIFFDCGNFQHCYLIMCPPKKLLFLPRNVTIR